MITFDPESSFPSGKNWGNPQVGQYYCNHNPSQGNSCILITTAGNGSGNGFIPGQPTQIEISLVSPSWGPFYNTQQSCESDCSNHYVFNCWNYNNGNSSPNVSFPHLTTAQKNHFCDVCKNDVAGSLIKSHPYCWCLDNGTGPHTNPPASIWSLAPHVYTCPTPPPPDGAQVEMCICDCPPPPIGPANGCSSNYTCPNSSQMSSAYLTIGGQTPQVGDKFYSDCVPQVNNMQSCTWEITAVGNLGTATGNRQLSTACDRSPCPNGMITPIDPNWGYCHECIGMQPIPSPWPTITGPNCECCDDTPIVPPTWDCCTYATCPGTFQLHYGPAWKAANPGLPTPSVNPHSRFCQERSDGTGQYYTFPACNEKCKHTPLPYHIRH